MKERIIRCAIIGVIAVILLVLPSPTNYCIQNIAALDDAEIVASYCLPAADIKCVIKNSSMKIKGRGYPMEITIEEAEDIDF